MGPHTGTQWGHRSPNNKLKPTFSASALAAAETRLSFGVEAVGKPAATCHAG